MSDLVWGETVTRDEFDRALRLGLGRTVLWLRTHPSLEFRDLILHACTHNLAFDRQIDGSRHDYLFDLVQASGEPEWYYDRIVAELMGPDYDQRYDDQMLEMLRLWAQHGHPTARHDLYQAFEAGCLVGNDSGANAIVGLDKAEGLTFVATWLGKLERVPDDYWMDRVVVSAAKGAGVADPMTVLNAAIAEHPSIAIYLERLAETNTTDRPKQRRTADAKVHDYNKLRAWLDEVQVKSRLPGFKAWGRNATEADLLLAAADLATETDTKRLRALLWVFGERAYPLDPAPLIALVDHPDHLLWIQAARDLENLAASAAVRSAALGWLAGSDERAAAAVGILDHQYEPGDHALIEALALRLSDDEAWHSYKFGAVNFYEAHPDPDSEVRVMLALYENNPCNFCREKVVKRLIVLNALSPWMAAECRLDAGPEIRKIMDAYDHPTAPAPANAAKPV